MYGGASKVVSARFGCACRKFRELSDVLVRKQGLSLKQHEICQCCVRPVSLYCCETYVADEARLRGLEGRMIRMCGVRLVDRVLTDVLHDRLSVAVKIEDMIIQSRQQWYDHIMRGDINSQICKVMEVEIIGKRKKGRLRKSWEKRVKKDLEQYGLR